jgi:hypothetical protein
MVLYMNYVYKRKDEGKKSSDMVIREYLGHQARSRLFAIM